MGMGGVSFFFFEDHTSNTLSIGWGITTMLLAQQTRLYDERREEEKKINIGGLLINKSNLFIVLYSEHITLCFYSAFVCFFILSACLTYNKNLSI